MNWSAVFSGLAAVAMAGGAMPMPASADTGRSIAMGDSSQRYYYSAPRYAQHQQNAQYPQYQQYPQNPQHQQYPQRPQYYQSPPPPVFYPQAPFPYGPPPSAFVPPEPILQHQYRGNQWQGRGVDDYSWQQDGWGDNRWRGQRDHWQNNDKWMNNERPAFVPGTRQDLPNWGYRERDRRR